MFVIICVLKVLKYCHGKILLQFCYYLVQKLFIQMRTVLTDKKFTSESDYTHNY